MRKEENTTFGHLLTKLELLFVFVLVVYFLNWEKTELFFNQCYWLISHLANLDVVGPTSGLILPSLG